MRKISAACIVAGVVLFSGSAFAVEDDIYTVRGVPVDAQAEEAAEARIIAIRQGRQMALRLLFQRLTLPIDWSLLPVLQSSEVTAMGAGFEVSNERNSPTRYLANMTYRFKPDEVRRVLREFDIPFSESQARKLVVLPVYELAGEVSIWEEENLWRQAWEERNYVNELVPLIAPLGDLSDVLSTPASSIQEHEFEGLAGYAARYGVRDILIVRFKQAEELPEIEDDPAQTGAQAANGHAALAGVKPIKVEAIRITAKETEGYQFNLPVSGDIESVMQNAIDRVVGRLQSDWKNKTIIRYGDQRPMSVSARFEAVGEWMKIRNAIDATPNVIESELIAMSTGGAQMNWSVVGTPDQLALSLSQHNVVLSPGDAKVSSLGYQQAPVQSYETPDYGPSMSETVDQAEPYETPSYEAESQWSGEGASIFFGGGNAQRAFIPANADPEFWIIRYQPEVTYDPFAAEELDLPAESVDGIDSDPIEEVEYSDESQPTSAY